MADRYLLESGAPDGYQLEDASGVLLLEAAPARYLDETGRFIAEVVSETGERAFPKVNEAGRWTSVPVAAGGGPTVSPAALSLGLALPAPSVTLLVAPGALGLGLGQPAPTIVLAVAPAALSLGLALPAPSLLLRVEPGALSLGLALPEPTITVAGGAQTIEPAALALGLGLPSPSVLLRVEPGALSLGLGQPAPTFLLRVDPAPLNLGLGLPAPAVRLSLAPPALDLGLGLPAPSLLLRVNPGALDLGLALPAPTLSVGILPIQPAALALGLGLPAPTVLLSLAPAALPLGLALVSPVVSLGAPPGAGRPVTEYAIELFDSGATFGPGSSLGEVWDARNLGWSRYDRMPGKAFFTIPQTSPLVSKLVALTTHVRFWRITPTLTTLVYVGIVADTDNTGDDVLVTCFDYGALLSISRTGYRTMYPVKALGTEILSPEWTLAKDATSSPLGFVTTGTIEDPTGTDGTTVIKTNNQFGLLDQMRLQLFYDLSEMGRANTAFHSTYEITRALAPEFKFLKNKGSDVGLGLTLGGNVSDYRHLPNWSAYRNDLATIGTTVGGGASEIVVSDSSAITAKGRRQDVFTIKTLLGIVGAATTADQQKAAADRMLKTALTQQPTLMLRMIRGGVDFFNGFDIADKATVEIGNGTDSIQARWRILGMRATFDEAGENPAVIVAPVAV